MEKKYFMAARTTSWHNRSNHLLLVMKHGMQCSDWFWRPLRQLIFEDHHVLSHGWVTADSAESQLILLSYRTACWVAVESAESQLILLRPSRACRITADSVGSRLILLSHSRFCWVTVDYVELQKSLLSHSRICRVTADSFGSWLILLSHRRFCWVTSCPQFSYSASHFLTHIEERNYGSLPFQLHHFLFITVKYSSQHDMWQC